MALLGAALGAPHALLGLGIALAPGPRRGVSDVAVLVVWAEVGRLLALQPLCQVPGLLFPSLCHLTLTQPPSPAGPVCRLSSQPRGQAARGPGPGSQWRVCASPGPL